MSDSKLPKETQLEKISGSLSANAAMTLISAFAGTPLAALLPVLTTTLAGSRHKARVEKAIDDISMALDANEKRLNAISDAQYKIVNEMVLAVFQTTEEKKLEYLRNVLTNSIHKSEISAQEADFISRVVRDMSAEEAEFLVDNIRFDRLKLSNLTQDSEDKALMIDPDSDDGMTVTGLISLGLLMPAGPSWDDSGLLRWAGVTRPLIELLGGEQSY